MEIYESMKFLFCSNVKYSGPNKGRCVHVAVASVTKTRARRVVGAMHFFFILFFSLRLLLRLLGEQDGLDVRQNTALCDGDAGKQLVQLLVVPDCQLQVTGNDAGFLVVSGRVTGQLEYFGGQVFHHGGQVNGRTGSHAFRVVSLPQESVDTADGKLKSGTAGARLRLSLDLTALSASGHDDAVYSRENVCLCRRSNTTNAREIVIFCQHSTMLFIPAGEPWAGLRPNICLC